MKGLILEEVEAEPATQPWTSFEILVEQIDHGCSQCGKIHFILVELEIIFW